MLATLGQIALGVSSSLAPRNWVTTVVPAGRANQSLVDRTCEHGNNFADLLGWRDAKAFDAFSHKAEFGQVLIDRVAAAMNQDETARVCCVQCAQC